MRPGLERAALLELLAHPTHRRHAKAQKLRDLSSALALLIELQNALAHRNRYGSHEHTVPHTFPLVKLHYLWKCSSPKATSEDTTAARRELGEKMVCWASLCTSSNPTSRLVTPVRSLI